MTISPVSTLSAMPAARPLSLSAPATVDFQPQSLPQPVAPQPRTAPSTADLAPAEAKPADLPVLGSSDAPSYPRLEKEIQLLPTPKEQRKEEFPPLKLKEEAQGTNLLANIQPTYFNSLVAKYAGEVKPMSVALDKAVQYMRSHPVRSTFDALT